MASEYELRLRDRLSRLRNVPLLGGDDLAQLHAAADRIDRLVACDGDEPAARLVRRALDGPARERRGERLDQLEDRARAEA